MEALSTGLLHRAPEWRALLLDVHSNRERSAPEASRSSGLLKDRDAGEALSVFLMRLGGTAEFPHLCMTLSFLWKVLLGASRLSNLF